MKVAIISDIHNNKKNLKKVLDFCSQKKIEKIICCGDLASIDTLNFLNDNFQGDIHYTFGNMDNGYLRDLKIEDKYKKTFIYKNHGETEIDGRKIAFVHYPQIARELAETKKFYFVFHGHTHKPWEEVVGESKILNPGNVAGEIYPPTFAIWNTENDKFELIRIDNL